MSLVPPNIGVGRASETDDAQALAEAYRKTVVDIQSTLFDKAATYSNLIIVAGYVGIFTIWGNTRRHIDKIDNITIAILLGISLAVFVTYQIVKMHSYAKHFLEVRYLLKDNIPSRDFFRRYNDLQNKSDRITLTSGAMTGYICFWFCVIPAIAALMLLAYHFLLILWRQ